MNVGHIIKVLEKRIAYYKTSEQQLLKELEQVRYLLSHSVARKEKLQQGQTTAGSPEKLVSYQLTIPGYDPVVVEAENMFEASSVFAEMVATMPEVPFDYMVVGIQVPDEVGK